MSNRGWWLGGILGLVVAGVIAGVLGWPGGHARAATRQTRPNIVFVLTDDMDWGLVKYMPHVIALERAGTTFNHYFVADSMCCPSRSTIFTGLFPHDSGVVANSGPNGGYPAFKKHHDEKKTFVVATQRAGYLNSMMGKYLNGYGDRLVHGDYKGSRMTHHVPPGWSDWHVSNAFGYLEFNYPLNENHRIVHYGNDVGSETLRAVVLGGQQSIRSGGPYMTDVLTRRAKAFINRAADAHKPFLMEVASFAPHRPFTPAPRDSRDFPGLRAPRDPSFNAPNINPPAWLGKPHALAPALVAKIDAEYRRRAQSVKDVDRLLATVEAQLKARGLAGNTYIVFSSDNGYHMGQHRLLPAKETAFETDIRVPLIVAGPGVPRNRVVSRVVQNIDLYPTFVQLAGGQPTHAIDGRSLVPLLHPAGGKPQPWRTVALIEHASPPALSAPGQFDPDLDYATSFAPGLSTSNPDPYHAIRIFNRQFGNAVYVEYTFNKSEREYYNIDKDPFERRNIYGSLSQARRNQLHRMVMALVDCHSAAACWKAGLPQP